MKICIDLTSLYDNFSGIERFALSITKEMISNEQHSFVLLFKNEIHNEFVSVPDNVEAIVINGSNKLWFNQVKLPLTLCNIVADKYFFPAFPAPFFYSNKKTISVIHDLSCWDMPSSNKWYMIWYFKVMYWKATRANKRVITVSNFSKGRIIDILKVKTENVEVAYNGISDTFQSRDKANNSLLTQKYNLPNDYFLCLSTLEPRKNLTLLIDAFSILKKQGVDYDLVLAGRKGWMIENLMQNVSEEVKKHIHFTGFVEDADLPEIYKRAKCFVFPSLYEGFGIPPLEAMACGTMVISSNATCMPEVLGDSAVYFENDNIDDLVRKLMYVINIEQNKRDMYIAKGIEQAKKYRWINSSEIVLNFISGN